MHPKKLSINDFTYHLPQEKIAKFPLPKRDESKLLVFKNEEIIESTYKNLDTYLPEQSLLIFNNTKVVEARLLFTKSTGGMIEIFCLEPHSQYPDITTAMQQKGKVFWKCLVGGAKKWKNEPLTKTLETDATTLVITANKIEQLTDSYIIEISWNDAQLTFAEILHIAGLIPLPPYLNRAAENADKVSYQTIYAKHDGSVAAPTAGLHFTEDIFKKLALKNIQKAFVTLHVGAGTFKPVKAQTMAEHEMHTEFIDVTFTAIEQLLANISNPIIAVGTTSLRTIESLYWLGVKVNEMKNEERDIVPTLSQWEAYELPQNISVKNALEALLQWMTNSQLSRLITKTQIIIAPGYTLKIARGLVTNFHQPQSTLLLLVAAIIGNNWRKVYNHALENEYRFLSYGDGCLLM
ncbi:MAG: S-adenosylmethionine:tRNA ribosyltransferase-isomerase [Deinococcales bacterium]|nr:S-adenosylmethionine:tRNA ribosyltransferase-isomerase [Chitinophagaceae bacterium]